MRAPEGAAVVAEEEDEEPLAVEVGVTTRIYRLSSASISAVRSMAW